ncbi:MAG TPA: hypothetical protein VFP84_15555 [Kofleriaceae bacterium]|nr:hypothetical protein [Kofleriaceae bacterium]
MLRLAAGVAAVLLLGRAPPAYAQFPPITNRDFAIDLYDGVAIGDSTQVGMGGAGGAVINGTAGVLLNPSAIAVRSTTDHGTWGLDDHLDVLTGQYSSDYDNNGRVASGGASLLTAGIGGHHNTWALAVTVTVQDAPVGADDSGLDAETLRTRFVLAKAFPALDLAIGAGVQRATFELQAGSTLFSISGQGLIAGATWLPHLQSFRVAASLDSAVDGGQVQTDACDPASCRGRILPDRVRSPWRAVASGAYRLAHTDWNQDMPGPFRDEYALTLAADVVVTGATGNGFGLEAFGMQELQRSGRHTAVSVRGGADVEAVPGRLRLRAGAYWEPARFDGVPGRLHGTFGVDLRVLELWLFGPRRIRLSALGDVASQYRNVGLSIGFWH